MDGFSAYRKEKGISTLTVSRSALRRRPVPCLLWTANRLIANAFGLRWEPMLEEWLSPLQRGFLPGRSMLANVVDVDEACVREAARSDKGALSYYSTSPQLSRASPARSSSTLWPFQVFQPWLCG